MVTKNDYGLYRFFRFAMQYMLLLILASCGTPPPTIPPANPTARPLPTITISVAAKPGDVANVDEGKGVGIILKIEPYEALSWTWNVSGTSGGTLNATQGENVVYTAGKEGVDIVVAKATTSDGTPIIKQVTINVNAAPTEVPAVTPNSASAVPPLEGIFLLVNGGVEFTFPEGQPDSIKRQFVEDGECLYSPPNSIQITYNFPKDSGGGWGIHWANLPGRSYNLEGEGFTKLTLMVRGKSGGETFQIGLKDRDQKEIMVQSERYVLVRSDEWRAIVIPLSDFFDQNGHVDLATIENMSIGFSSAHGSGSICIDEIAFQK